MAQNTYTLFCPKCEDCYVSARSFDMDDGEITVKVQCSNCGFTFFECYEFYGYKKDTCYEHVISLVEIGK